MTHGVERQRLSLVDEVIPRLQHDNLSPVVVGKRVPVDTFRTAMHEVKCCILKEAQTIVV